MPDANVVPEVPNKLTLGVSSQVQGHLVLFFIIGEQFTYYIDRDGRPTLARANARLFHSADEANGFLDVVLPRCNWSKE